MGQPPLAAAAKLRILDILDKSNSPMSVEELVFLPLNKEIIKNLLDDLINEGKVIQIGTNYTIKQG